MVWMLVSAGTPPAQVIRDAGRLAPSARQLAWQREELTAFIHFGPNTFTNREWGTGKESPDAFDPSSLDTDQWARALKEAGFKKVILVAKHHDGFVLWPTRYTQHSVKSSRWMGGHGDVVGSFVRSAHKYGLLVGFYLSPADLYQAQAGGAFANGSARRPVTIPTLVKGDTRKPSRFFHFVLDDYNAYYLNELYELLTQYGPVEEVWFDGANPLAGSGRVQPYDFGAWYTLVHTLQPQAVIFPIDLNWVGNERGYARLSQWSVIPLTGPPVADQSTHAVDVTSDALGSDASLTSPRTRMLRWMPSECDVPLEPGWFWHPGAQPKSLAKLKAIYYASVGRNCQLLLDVPPDRRGLFDSADLTRLHEFGAWVRDAFATDLAAGATMRTDRTATTPTFAFTLPGTATFTTIELREHIEDGQRIARFTIEARSASGWRRIATGTTVGYKRLLLLPSATTADAIRVRVLAARDTPMLAGISLYR